MTRFAIVLSLVHVASLLGFAADKAAKNDKSARKVVLIAGKKSHGPVGNGIHDYPWSAKLLKVMLENSNVADRVRVEYHLGGWPKDARTLDDADTIMVISDGRDGDRYEEAPHLSSEERVKIMQKQIDRGCGFMTFHFSTFAPDRYAEKVLDWSGGYFDWETGGRRKWYSAIKTLETEVKLGSPKHAVSRGLKPLRLREEFYYNIRFHPADKSFDPIWIVPDLPGREPHGRCVAWARQRKNGGRGFGTTAGHFYDNWQHANFRKMILNAIVWTTGLEVPARGVQAKYYPRDEITAALSAKEPIRVLTFAGNEAHKWHNWEKSTAAVKSLLEKDPRMKVEVSLDIEDLGKKKLTDYHAIVLNNYANWHDPKQLSEESKQAFVRYLKGGGGLVVVHFANGAFHFSLPKAGESDWPEYRKIVRRVWNHQGTGEAKSGHDSFGRFTVNITKSKHPVTEGLSDFDVTDELYFRQDGTEPIEPLITARSKVTKRDEPLAWTYRYHKARVFQTLLGHSEKTYDSPAACEMLRRAVAWVACREVRSPVGR